MQIDPPMRRNCQSCLRNNSTVGNNGGDIRGKLRDPGGGIRIDLGRTDDVDTQLQCPRRDGRRRQHPLPAQGGVRSRQDSDDIESRLDQSVQRWDRDGGGSCEKDPHSGAPKLPPPKLDPTLVARWDVVFSVMAW